MESQAHVTGDGYFMSGGKVVPFDLLIGKAMPDNRESELTRLTNLLTATTYFSEFLNLKKGDVLVVLADRLLDVRVIAAIRGVARARGIEPIVLTHHTSQVPEMPDWVKPLIEQATVVISTWFCSVIDPFNVAMRKRGQRWIKITFFRDFDLLYTPQARFPFELVGELAKATAKLYPRERPFDLKFSDSRGTDFRIGFTARMSEKLMSTNRWRGVISADEPGCYSHYLPTHGPNIYERGPCVDTPDQVVDMTGTVYPQWAVGFPEPFREKIGVRFDKDEIVEVTGESANAAILRDMLMGGKLIELGCGFNPKAPRHQIYPAGSNAVGALHFGIDLVKPSDYIRKTMPDWEEPPIHMDLVTFDSTVHAGDTPLMVDGVLEASHDPVVRAAAAAYGDPVELLDRWVE
ncbi:hypothetical protein [Paraburkholderia caribensis]|uniref:hypothetical protein n=1 Tax=Paraburkholderia caribensis TaxID=75105 RepID=UPI001CB0608D|nr:hypothetical protein [Paraburkholderia caribensis]CAG9263044.1 conserved hypothetical protein [Paraburkholderia caribensis]